MLRQFFINRKKGTEYLNYGRHIIRKWGKDYILRKAEATDRQYIISRLLDIGCGHGTDLINIKEDVLQHESKKSFIINLSGIENYKDYIKECQDQGIKIFPLDIEHDEYPGDDSQYDLVIANQILEHTKEIFWIFEEVTRILKPGGQFIIGVPNLAGLHNRLLLLFGRQPTVQQTMSAHVRGFTKHDLKYFAETGGYFRLLDFKGSNFYPFGPSVSMPMSRMFPSFAWGIFFLFERTEKIGNFLKCLENDDNLIETPFYGSPRNPVKRKWRIFDFLDLGL